MKSLRSRIRNLFPRKTGAMIITAASIAAPSAVAAPKVVLIHGIWDTSWTLRPMDAAIREAGFDTLLIELKPNDGSASLDELGTLVHRIIETKLDADATFSIVGLSMGGLVARSYLRQFGDPSRIPAVITIASPHHGTWLARFREFPGVKDMRPDSKFLQRLKDDHLRFNRTKWTTIRTPFDLMILPSTSSVLPWAENHSVPVLAHPLLAFDRRVIDRTLLALGVSTKSESAEPASRRGGSLRKRIPGIPPLPKASPEAQ